MQEEWQRRQTQRGVWALLGLLAVVSATTAAPPYLLPAGSAAATCLSAVPREVEAAGAEVGSAARSEVASRYWRGLAPETDARVRRRLWHHAIARPLRSPQGFYLRRFLRPPPVA